MHALLSRAINPPLSLRQLLPVWRRIAAALREPRRKRSYQRDRLREMAG
jgi:hypothetical protein